jgi:YgiT-type zinc finger domain-containing protein
MQCQNCNMEDMVKGTVPIATQRGEATILAHKVPAMICSSCDFYLLDESVKARVAEVFNDRVQPGAEVITWRYAEKEDWEDD